MRARRFAVLGLASAGLASGGWALAEDPLTHERLVSPEAENWLLPHGNYAVWRHSTLTEINRDNVAGLRMAFAVPLDVMPDLAVDYSRYIFGGNDSQGVPLVNGGMLYITDPTSTVYKINVSSGNRGQILWSLDPEIQPSEGQLVTTRGAGLIGAVVIVNTPDGRVLGVDTESGEAIWENRVGRDGEGFDAQPIPVKDNIIISQSLGDMGTRGYAVALNPQTGEEVWRFNVVPGPGEAGHETWPQDTQAWRTGGGGLWTAPSYDPEANLIYFGSGNPAPAYDAEYRPGDNLYTASTIAVDGDTGAVRWYHQYTPNDGQERDEVGSNLLVNRDGQALLTHISRTGFYFTFDRLSGQFLNAVPLQDNITWTAGIDPKTGKPVEYDPNLDVQQYAGKPMRNQPAVEVCGGGFVTGIWPVSYDPDLNRVFNATADNQCQATSAEETTEAQMLENRGAFMLLQGRGGAVSQRPFWRLYGIDAVSGERVASAELDLLSQTGTLSTPGLIFIGHPDGTFAARNSETLEVLWSVNVGMPLKGPPIAYAVDGKQYIAFSAGGPPDGVGIAGTFPEAGEIRTASMLWVFTL